MKSDAEFLHALQGSQAHVSAVAGWLATKNFDVLIRPTTVRPDFDSRNDYADCGDIELRQRVEVKQRDLDFTCAQDFPYPTVIVDEKFKVDRIPKPHLWGYLIMNRALTHLCCIRPAPARNGRSRASMTTKTGRHVHFTSAARNCARFTAWDEPDS